MLGSNTKTKNILFDHACGGTCGRKCGVAPPEEFRVHSGKSLGILRRIIPASHLGDHHSAKKQACDNSPHRGFPATRRSIAAITGICNGFQFFWENVKRHATPGSVFLENVFILFGRVLSRQVRRSTMRKLSRFPERQRPGTPWNTSGVTEV